MSETTQATVNTWLAAPMDPKVRAAIDRLARTEDVRHIAVMPDVHLAADVCIGTIVATGRLIFPAAVGGDIGCGMLALAVDTEANVLADPARAAKVFEALHEAAPPMRRRRSRRLGLPAFLDGMKLSHSSLESIRREEGKLQFGTLGGGNHFIELQADEEDRLWLMIHSGSRAMGQAIRNHHLSRASRVGTMLALDAYSAEGQNYLHDMAWARSYADANRHAMAEQLIECLRQVLGIRAVEASLITCDHNHVACEEHDGEQLWVHRKGAMPADEGLPGVLPGSMGTLSYHVVGRGCQASLRSSAHGAGRSLSREAARRRFTGRELCRQMKGVWFDHRIADRLRDESPGAYKDIRAVLRAQHELVRVTRTLKPILSYKGG